MSQQGILADVTSPGGDIETISGDVGGKVGPDGTFNVNLVGGSTITVSGNPGTNTLTINPSVAGYPTTPFVVGPVGEAGYATIQAGLDAANAASGGIVYVQPGAYTENLTLYDGVQVVSAGLPDPGDGVEIIGTHTPPAAGGFVFRSVRLTSATDVLASAVAGTAYILISNSEVNVTNGYLLNLPNWTGTLELRDVNEASLGTNDGCVNNSGGSLLLFFNGSYGVGNGNTMIVSGTIFTDGAKFFAPINFQTGSSLGIQHSNFFNIVTALNNTTGNISNCTFQSTGAGAFTMSSASSIAITNCMIDTTNNPAIDGAGAGTLTLTGIDFVDSSTLAGTLTVAAGNSYSGTYKSDYTDHGVLLGQGAVSDIIATAVGTDGQLLIGATGADPAFANLTSTGGTVTFTEGVNTLNLEAGGSVAIDFDGDVGTATPVANTINILGTAGQGISTAAAGNTVTITAADASAIQKGVASYNIYDFVLTAGVARLREGVNILFVGKHGNDAADGTTWENAYLTFTFALTAAAATDVIVCLDQGVYTENLTDPTGIRIYAPNATISGAHTMIDNSDWFFNTALVATGTSGFILNTAAAEAHLILSNLNAVGTGIGVVCLQGKMFAHIDHGEIANGFMVGSLTTDEVYCTFEEIEITGTGIAFGIAAAGDINIIGECVEDAGAGTLFFAAGIASNIAAQISKVEVQNLSNITALTNVRLNVARLAGALAEIGAGTIDGLAGATRIDGVPIGGVAPASGIFTTVTDTSRTQHAVSIYGASGILAEVGPLTDGQLVIGSTGVAPAAATLTAGNGITITNAAGAITIKSNDGGMTWTEVTGVGPTAMVVDNGYVANNVALVTLTLPATAAVGDIIKVDGKGAGGFLIAQNAGQTVHFLAQDSTPGVGGSISSTHRYDCVTLRCITADTDWIVESPNGNITVT